VIVFGVSGLWHGANWTFIAWGLYHACLIALSILLGKNIKYKEIIAAGKILPSVRESFQLLTTFVLVMVGWVIFRSETLTDAVSYLVLMFSSSLLDWHTAALQLGKLDGIDVTLPAIALLMVIEWLGRDRRHALQFRNDSFIAKNMVFRYFVYIVLIMSLVGLGGSQSEFIYFQF
jgi:D-alanyl-lipoteichoic acid acyltransferase DltB (MBOAT superfamily)